MISGTPDNERSATWRRLQRIADMCGTIEQAERQPAPLQLGTSGQARLSRAHDEHIYIDMGLSLASLC